MIDIPIQNLNGTGADIFSESNKQDRILRTDNQNKLAAMPCIR
jgi:hypothetical protein